MFPQMGVENYDALGHFGAHSFGESSSLAGGERFVGGDGSHADAFMDTGKLRDAAAGFTQIRRNADLRQQRRIREAGRLYADVLMGRADPILIKEAMNPRNEFVLRHLWEQYPGLKPDLGGRNFSLRETMAVTDYQSLYIDVLDRLYYSTFQAYPINNKQLVKVHTLRDFRIVKRYLLDGLVTPYTSSDPGAPPPQFAMLGPAPQNGAIPSTPATSTAAITYSPLLYQAMASINWAAFVGDDLGIFKDVPNRLATKAARGIAKFITEQYVDVNGPNTTNGLFQSGYHNQILQSNGASSDNPPLSIQGIADGYNILAGQLDSTGDPIMMDGPAMLVYGPSNYSTAMNLKNQLENWTTQQGGVPGTAQPGQMLRVTNWATQNLTLVYDPYLPLVATSAKNSWLMFVNPNGQNRPAIEVGFLQGFEDPQLFTEVPTTQRMGGSPDPMMGNFYNNNSNIKVLGVMGASPIDGRSVVGSTGTGHA
jgi:hypothetical protein